MSSADAIAVVIPALDEAERVGRAVASALEGATDGPARETGETAETEGLRDFVDVWVVDGGSRDATVAEARRAGARAIAVEAGRGRQLDAGWRATSADVVLFLHADTRLPPRWREGVRSVLEDVTVAGGAFRYGVDERGAAWRLLEWGVALRVGLFKLPYGDQAIFVRRRVLAAAGGVPHVAILEDLDLVRLIKRHGRLAMLPQSVTTSARRHRGQWLATLSRHALALAGFFLGVDRAWLARRVRP